MSGQERPTMAELLIYGAYGYTGRLIAEEAVGRGFEPVLAGRDGRKLREVAGELGCASRVFSLDGSVSDQITDITAVLNCAGPFVETCEPLVEACIESGTHYLDITGEIEAFETVASYDEPARVADVMLLPGVGFDVVPTDCLGSHLHGRLPTATNLTLAFDPPRTLSPGTAVTALEHANEGGKVRRDGDIVDVPLAHRKRRIDFGNGPRTVVTIPWGDVSTAYHTTGIPNIEVYVTASPGARAVLRGSRYLGPLIGVDPVGSWLQAVVRGTVSGPGERRRRRKRAAVWGEVRNDGTGERAVSLLRTPETYALTVDAAATATGRTLEGDVSAGFQTPAGVYGPDFVLDLAGVERVDVE